VLALAAAVFEGIGLNTPFGRNLLAVVTLTAIGAVTFRGWSAANRLARFK
jgi:hypothetical protein